ncbi:MAG: hypothetical protein IKK33_06565 [Lachnospiraceae bacterium]|nr:hypothetical protein [Lachnospiraceae bacterium]
MSVEVLQIITLMFFVLSGALFIVSICLFFAFNIPGVIGNLSGITAKKAIEDIKAKNDNVDKLQVTHSHFLKNKHTEKVAGSGNIGRMTGPFRHGKGTRKLGKVFDKTASLGKKDLGETVRLDTVEVRETTILSASMENVVLMQWTGELPTFSVDVDIILCECTEAIE